MAADDCPYDAEADGPAPAETSTRRHKSIHQLDFELAFFAQILECDPLYVAALRVHGDNLARAGRHSQALVIDRRLVRLLPDRAIPWYNLGCTYAVLGMTEPAFGAIQRALELGYRHLDHLCRDPDLRPLRRDPRFARLFRRFGVVPLD